MHAPGNSFVAAAMLLSAASALPNLVPRETDAAFRPWVSVDDDGVPETITPVSSTVSGTPTLVDAAPARVTGSVLTIPYYETTITSSGTPFPAPTGDVSGAFYPCTSQDGEEGAPWCFPHDGDRLNPGRSYYFLWDAKAFTGNATVRISAHYLDAETGEKGDEVFKSPKLQAKNGFWTCNIEKHFMDNRVGNNITLTMSRLASGGNETEVETIEGPRVLIAKPPRASQPSGSGANKPAIYIGLPTIFGFIILCLVGTCLWNRRARRITIGNVMSRARHGGSGFPLGKRSRASKQRKADERIALMERELAAEGGDVYRDNVPPSPPSIPRRDSDALGSLAGTPTEDRRMDFDGVAQGQNRFRDELKRQNNERF